MNIEADRSNRIAFVVGVVVVPFAVGLALPLWGTQRNLINRDAGLPAALQLPAEHILRMRMRISGATVLLAGVSQFASDIRVQTVFMLCAGAVGMAGFFEVPKRLFTPTERAE
jgi:hypothetical protein